MVDYTEGSEKQYRTQAGVGDAGRYVILPGDPKRCEKIAKYFDDAHLTADSREYVTYTGTLEGVPVSVTSTGIKGLSAAIVIEYPAVPDVTVMNALIHAAKKQKITYHTGVVQCKDSFFGQHEPKVMPVSHELQNEWEEWIA